MPRLTRSTADKVLPWCNSRGLAAVHSLMHMCWNPSPAGVPLAGNIHAHAHRRAHTRTRPHTRAHALGTLPNPRAHCRHAPASTTSNARCHCHCRCACVAPFSAAPLLLQVRCIPGNQRHDWTPGTTHVVMHGPRRNQKSLAMMAAGGWLVGPGWVEASVAAGRMVPEVRGGLVPGGGAGALPALFPPSTWL